MREYDVVIIGSGTAGQTAASELAGLDLRLALVESSERPGGVCALRGCQAKKWFYEVMELVARSRHLRDLGVSAPPEVDWQQILRQKNTFTESVPGNTIKSLKGMDVAYLSGRARFTGEATLAVGTETVKAEAFIIATGARPRELPLPGAEHLATSADFLDLAQVPGSVIFIGGGFVSFEFAHFAARLGSDRVHILEAGPRPLRPFDADMVARLVEAGEEDGIRLDTDIEITAVKRTEGGFRVEIEGAEALEAELVVNGAGRVAQIEDLELEAAGVAVNDDGIAVNASMRTSNPRIYAAGDCAATTRLARVADYEARTAAGAIIAARSGEAPPEIDYTPVPSVLFSYPQLGMVGKTEQQLQEEQIKYWKSYDTGLGWPTYRRVGLKHAAYKILVGEDERILGAHFLADNTTGLLNTFKQAMIDGATIARLRDDNIMAPYPSRESDITYMLAPLLE